MGRKPNGMQYQKAFFGTIILVRMQSRIIIKDKMKPRGRFCLPPAPEIGNKQHTKKGEKGGVYISAEKNGRG